MGQGKKSKTFKRQADANCSEAPWRSSFLKRSVRGWIRREESMTGEERLARPLLNSSRRRNRTALYHRMKGGWLLRGGLTERLSLGGGGTGSVGGKRGRREESHYTGPQKRLIFLNSNIFTFYEACFCYGTEKRSRRTRRKKAGRAGRIL